MLSSNNTKITEKKQRSIKMMLLKYLIKVKCTKNNQKGTLILMSKGFQMQDNHREEVRGKRQKGQNKRKKRNKKRN